MKKRILVDIKNVASKLKYTPTLQEYVAQGGKFTRHAIEKAFGPGYWLKAVAEAGLKVETLSVTDQAGYDIAKLKAELKAMQKYCESLEHEAVSAKSLKALIGAPDWNQIGEESGWMNEKTVHTSSVTGIPTLFISDVHFDEVVKSEQVAGANEYNHEIAVRRIKHTFKTAVDMTKKFLSKPKYEGFICAFGGDIFSGNIHEELKESNEQRILKSCLDLEDLFIEGIGTLADEFGKVFVPCVVGNHARMDRKPRFKFRVQDNFEWMLYQHLARYFRKDSRISFLIPEAADAQWQVYGKKYLMNHGDQFQGGTGISGAFSPLMLGRARKQHKQTALDKPFDIMILGHWHQYIHTESLIINGSIKGYDEYADQHNFPFELPRQALWIDHPEKGHGIYRMPILCEPEMKKKSSRVHIFGE